MWEHCLDGVQSFSFIRVNVVFGLAGVFATADLSLSSLVSVMCFSGDLMVILTDVQIVTGEGNLVSSGFLCQIVWPQLM